MSAEPELTELNEMIEEIGGLLARVADDDPERPEGCFHLGKALLRRSVLLNDLQDIDNAVRFLTEAVAGELDEAIVHWTLGEALSTRSQGRGIQADLDVAIVEFRRAVDVTDPEDHDFPIYCYHLGRALGLRLEYRPSEQDLAEALTALHDAGSRGLTVRAYLLFERFRRGGDLNDADVAVEELRAAIAAEEDAESRSDLAMYLSDALRLKATKLPEADRVECLAEAIAVLTANLRADSPSYSALVGRLGQAQLAYGLFAKDVAALTAAAELLAALSEEPDAPVVTVAGAAEALVLKATLTGAVSDVRVALLSAVKVIDRHRTADLVENLINDAADLWMRNADQMIDDERCGRAELEAATVICGLACARGVETPNFDLLVHTLLVTIAVCDQQVSEPEVPWLDTAIAMLALADETLPDSDSVKVQLLLDLAGQLAKRAHWTDSPTDHDRVIGVYHRALAIAGPERRPAVAGVLAHSLVIGSHLRHSDDDLDEALRILDDAQFEPDDPILRSAHNATRALARAQLLFRDGTHADREAAFSALAAAVADAPTLEWLRVGILVVVRRLLSDESLSDVVTRSSSPELFKQLVAVCRYAVDVADPKDRETFCYDFGTVVLNRLTRRHFVLEADQIVELLRWLADRLTELGQERRALGLVARGLTARAKLTGSVDDLDEAVTKLRSIVDDSPDKQNLFNRWVLADVLHERFTQVKLAEDLDAALGEYRTMRSLTEDYGGFRRAYVACLMTAYRNRQDDRLLEEIQSIQQLDPPLFAVPNDLDGDQPRPSIPLRVTAELQRRFDIVAAPDDLDRVIATMHRTFFGRLESEDR